MLSDFNGIQVLLLPVNLLPEDLVVILCYFLNKDIFGFDDGVFGGRLDTQCFSLSGRAPQPPLNQISLYVKSYPLSFLFLSTQGVTKSSSVKVRQLID